MEAEAIIALVIVSGVLVGLFGVSWTPLGRAVIRRLRGPASATDDPEPRPDLIDVHDLERRVAELEERADFTERLLARRRDADERVTPPR